MMGVFVIPAKVIIQGGLFMMGVFVIPWEVLI
jgi:hypothetical protein